MAPRRADLLVALAGAAVGASAAVIWGDAGSTVSVVLLGALLGGYRLYPRATWILAATLLVATSAQGSLPGDDVFATYPLVAAHAFCAGRWDAHWRGLGGLITFVVAGEVAAVLAHDEWVPFLFIGPAGWGAGRALHEREQVAAQLSERASELDEEREAYAALSVRYERARIASELHDIVAHALSVMVVQAGAGQRLAAHDPERTAETFEAIAGAARQAENDMTRLVALLGDEDAIEAAPDLALVEELVARAAGSGLDVTLRLEGEREGFPAPVGQTAYRIVQEGLTNALRYGSGAAVAVRVRGDNHALVVEVVNGPPKGDAALAGVGTGNGLRGLRERVGACGGTLEAGPTLDAGWRLSARLPRRVAVAAS